MKKELINPESLGRPSGFNHGIVTEGGRLLFLAGQTGSDSTGRIVSPGDLVSQVEQTLRNLEAVVREAGGEMTDIVQLTAFVRDREDYLAKLKPLGRVFRQHFGAYYPTMALFEVSGFFQDDALAELQGIAVLG